MPQAKGRGLKCKLSTDQDTNIVIESTASSSIVTFAVLNNDGSVVGHAEVERLATMSRK